MVVCDNKILFLILTYTYYLNVPHEQIGFFFVHQNYFNIKLDNLDPTKRMRFSIYLNENI